MGNRQWKHGPVALGSNFERLFVAHDDSCEAKVGMRRRYSVECSSVRGTEGGLGVSWASRFTGGTNSAVGKAGTAPF